MIPYFNTHRITNFIETREQQRPISFLDSIPSIIGQDPTAVLSDRVKQFRDQGMSWQEIYAKLIDDFAINIELVFTKNIKARKTFTTIVSDFYMRPDYWGKLFEASLDEIDVNRRIGTISQSRLSPIVASQFSNMTAQQMTLRYLGHSLPGQERKISIFENLQGAEGWNTISKFYREYFFREADEQEVLLFWHFILNSVIRDLMEQTKDPNKVSQVARDKDRFIDQNMRLLEMKNEQPLALARQALLDATSNWLFTIPVAVGDKVKTCFVLGPKYVAKKLRVANNVLYDRETSFTLARKWTQNMIDQKTFSTFLTEKRGGNLVYTPVDIDLYGKPTKEYTIRTIPISVAFQFIRSYHSAVSNPNPRGVMYAVGAYDRDEQLVAVLVINTPQQRTGDYKGQYHIVEITRIIVPDSHRGEGLSTLLLKWMLQNKNLFNRSQFDEANLWTYSLLTEPGTIYQRVQGFYPVSLYIPAKTIKKGRTNIVTNIPKIRWESNPKGKPAKWLPYLHPFYMLVFRGINAWNGESIPKTVSKSDFRYFKNMDALTTIMKLLRIDARKWKSNTGKRLSYYKSTDDVSGLIQALIFYINNTEIE